MIFKGVKQGLNVTILRRFFPELIKLVQTHCLGLLAPRRLEHVQYTRSRVDKRMAMQEDRPDFMHSMLGKQEGGKAVGSFVGWEDTTG